MENETKDNFSIIASISKWKQNPNSQIEYSLHLFSELTNQSWEIMKTLTDFHKFNQYLLQAYSDLPIFPDADYAILNLQKTKVLIGQYMTQILNRSDIISNPETATFFELINHLPNIRNDQPFCLGSDDEKEQRTSLCCYAKQLNLFFISYSTKSDMTSLLITGINSSEIIVKRYNFDDRKMDVITQIKVNNAITMINYVNASDMNFLLVGLVNGAIQLYNIMKPKPNIIQVEKMSEVKPHSTRLLNFGFDVLSGYIYSTGINDTSITISEINYEKIISKVKISNSSLTAFEYDNDKKIIIIVDQLCSISIYKLEGSNNFKMLQAFHGSESKLSDFSYDFSLNYIFIGTIMSEASIYHYNTLTNQIEKLAEMLVDKSQRYKVTGITYRKCRKELIVSLSNGKIQFWSHDNKYPEYVIDCCVSHLKGIIYIEEADMMVSICGEAKKKYWLLPQQWPGEEMRKNESSIFEKKKSIKDIQFVTKTEDQLNQSKDKKTIEEDEDSSYLDGWDCDDNTNKEILTTDLILPMML